MRGRQVDWTRPVYKVAEVTSHPSSPEGSMCDVCRQRFKLGERFRRGPRGRLIVHADCVAAPVADPVTP